MYDVLGAFEQSCDCLRDAGIPQCAIYEQSEAFCNWYNLIFECNDNIVNVMNNQSECEYTRLGDIGDIVRGIKCSLKN